MIMRYYGDVVGEAEHILLGRLFLSFVVVAMGALRTSFRHSFTPPSGAVTVAIFCQRKLRNYKVRQGRQCPIPLIVGRHAVSTSKPAEGGPSQSTDRASAYPSVAVLPRESRTGKAAGEGLWLPWRRFRRHCCVCNYYCILYTP
jgi:hypothetical protein